MEGIGGLLLIGFFLVLIYAPALIIRPIKAFFRSASGKGKFTENLRDEFATVGPLEFRVRLAPPEDGLEFDVFLAELRGAIDVSRPMTVGYSLSIFDATDPSNLEPIICTIDDFCEPHSSAFQVSGVLGQLKPNMGLIRWVRMGAAIPSILVAPYSGERTLRVVVRLYNTTSPPDINLGFVDRDSGEMIVTRWFDVSYNFENVGYVENAERRRLLRPLYVKLAMAVAFADGDFHESEGKLIQEWVGRQLAMLSESNRELVKSSCNDALREAFAQGQAGTLSLTSICEEIVEVTDLSQRYEAIELCLEVMAADGKADASELDVIKRVAAVFELDVEELQRLKDQKLIALDTSDAFESSFDGMNDALGIDPNWSDVTIRKHLRDEFKRWNGRLNNLSDPAERANVQARLELISKARQHYG